MRYTGQGWEIPIDLTEAQAMAPDAATFHARFEEDYTKLFGRPVAGMDIEITVWSVNATPPPEQVAQIATAQDQTPASSDGTRAVFDAATGTYLDAQIVSRAAWEPGQRVAGPAAVTEAETTIIVPASMDAICQPDGCIDTVTKG